MGEVEDLGPAHLTDHRHSLRQPQRETENFLFAKTADVGDWSKYWDASLHVCSQEQGFIP
jgi:hypothetical protein